MLPSPEATRLVTIIAHVDHGKTTLADNLIESNGIISERLAGTLRYLDSDAEEQRRGITMRASAIGLKHVYVPPKIVMNKAMLHNQNQNNNNNNNGASTTSTAAASSSTNAPRDMVIHLIDSPGHVDFSAEVTSSLLLCDSAILVVDAVEGLCARTHSLVREAYLHQLVPVLVINKVDRLCMEMGLDPSEAYVRIRELVESMNAVCASMVTSSASLDDNSNGDSNGNNNSSSSNTKNNKDDGDYNSERMEQEAREHIWNFDPIKGNVVFSSALHGWGFTIPTLARSLFKSKTVPMKPPLLRQYLFGDFKYNTDSGKVLKWKQSGSSGAAEPMFAQYALAPLWEIYEGVSQAAASVGMKSELFFAGDGNNTQATCKKSEYTTVKIEATTSGMERVIDALQMGSTSPSAVSPQPNKNGVHSLPQNAAELQQVLSRIGAGSEESIVSAVLRRYRPLSDSILDAVCETGPSPAEATLNYRTRALALQKNTQSDAQDNNNGEEEFKNIQEAVRQCNPGDDVPTVAHVCKFTSTNRSSVTDPDLPPLNPDADPSSANMIMGIARVLSGTLKTEDVEYHMFGPRYTGLNCDNDDVPKQRIRCYLLMGSSFVRVNSVPAGHICAIYNLEALQLKTVTLCDRRECMPLHGFDFGLQPLVKVNVEPVSASDAETLERGLMKLSLADSSVEVTATAKGERILACLGEIHLEQSILDLENVYCENNIKLRISDPITSFCETTDWFSNEGDFDAFLVGKSPPMRQATIPPYCDEEGLGYANRGRCRAILSGRGAAISFRVVPLPRSVYECLRSKELVEGSEESLLTVGKALKCSSDVSSLTPQTVLDVLLSSLDDIDANGNALLESSTLFTGHSVKAVKSANGEVYVPQKEEAKESEYDDVSVPEGLAEYETTRQFLKRGLATSSEDDESSNADSVALQKWRQDMRGSALAGFQLAMRSGPLCEEPMRGVAVILESVEIAVTKGDSVAKDLSGGMVVAALRSGVRCAMLTRPARLVESHFRLTLHSSLAGLGSLHAVLSRRRGKVVTDDMVDGTDLIQVTATIPQAESFVSNNFVCHLPSIILYVVEF